MDFSTVPLDDDLRAFQAEVDAFMTEHITEEVLEEERRTGNGFNLGVHLALGQKGWILPTRPAEQGGAGLDPVRARMLALAMSRYCVPWVTMSTTALVLPAVEKFGHDDIRADISRKVAEGTVRFCLGYTEPDGGSDIAAAKVRAVRDGEEWVLNGSKIFTTGAQNAQYVFLITRTDPDLPKHKGLTMFLVPLDTPGIEIQAIRTYGNERTNIVYYSDVRISDVYRLGGVNDGWSVLHGPLDEEHSFGEDLAAKKLSDLSIGTMFANELGRGLEAALEWARTAVRPDGSHPIDDPRVRARLGRVAIELEAAFVTPGPEGRVKGSDVLVEYGADLMDLLGADAVLSEATPDAVAGGRVDYGHRYAQGTATYGGTVEVFRTIIAQHVLGLPKPQYPGARVFLQKKASDRPVGAVA
jgi:alkylation response protein AidB-like acyl-CoA dehydrogenase